MRIRRPTMNYTLSRSAGRDTRIALTLAIALAIAPTTALARLKVSGDPGAVMVEAQNASIEEVLTVLSQQFNFRYRSSANLETQITGTYRGPLRRVLTRILGGRDFVVKSTNSLLEVTVLEKGPTFSKAAQAPAASQFSPNPQAAPKQLTTPSQASLQAGDPSSDTASVSAAPLPELKLAEGPAPVPGSSKSPLPVPVPTPVPSAASLPAPVPGSADSAPGPVPEPQPSNVTLPGPLVPGARPENIPVPPGPTSTAPDPT
jgi:hypothetical protein